MNGFTSTLPALGETGKVTTHEGKTAAILPVPSAQQPVGLYTVEYEELRAGQTAAGIEMSWYKCIEVFRVGQIDRALDRVLLRCMALDRQPERYRDVTIWPWAESKGATGGR